MPKAKPARTEDGYAAGYREGVAAGLKLRQEVAELLVKWLPTAEREHGRKILEALEAERREWSSR